MKADRLYSRSSLEPTCRTLKKNTKRTPRTAAHKIWARNSRIYQFVHKRTVGLGPWGIKKTRSIPNINIIRAIRKRYPAKSLILNRETANFSYLLLVMTYPKPKKML